MKDIQTIRQIREQVSKWRNDGEQIGFVPTMGALHEGHLSLVRLAQERSSKSVASIYVNPAQFAPNEDFETYPRPLDEDLEKLEQLGVDAVYMPSSEEMYPDGFATHVHVDRLSDGLCSLSRPHFFDGVALVVSKLLLQVLPDLAVFGEKDYQQLMIIRQMVKDLNIPVTIVGGPTQREADGLAMSSRNAYLSTSERAVAGKLNVILKEAALKIENLQDVSQTVSGAISQLTQAGFSEVDYFEFRDSQTLSPQERNESGGRLLAAAKLGRTRLIDNWPVREPKLQ